jgi:hypothetical protein
MTTQNVFLTSALVALAGTVIFETRIVVRQRGDLEATQKRAVSEARRVARLRGEHDAAQENLVSAEKQLAGLPMPPVLDPAGAARQGEIKAWLARLKQLQRLVAERPNQSIPELRLLADEDWLRVAQDAAFADEHDLRRALGNLRRAASNKFFQRATAALRNYAKTVGDEAPYSILALAGHFEQPIDAAILQRYEVSKGSLSSNPRQVGLVMREKAAVDEDYDSRTEVSSGGGLTSAGPPFAWPRDISAEIRRAMEAYSADHNGARAASVGQAIPYFDPPLAPSKIEALRRLERERPK